ncbi:MAG: homoserine lactone transporter [Marinilabiliales bacterium]|nr:MAG: homoserine lactone transporter [Marinilabiliales bacterium]
MDLSLYIIASILLIITPGPDFIYVSSRSVSEGNKIGIISALGISVGFLVHSTLTCFGLAAIIQTSPFLYILIKYIGAAYLTFIGIKILYRKAKPNKEAGYKSNNPRNAFLQGIMTNVLNPKALIIFMSFIPQFINPDSGNTIWQMLFLGVIFCLIATIWYCFIGFFSGHIGTLFKNNPKTQALLNYMSGTVLIALGIKLLLEKK